MFGISSKKGFTLLELMVVIFIMGMIAAVLGPTLFSRRTPRYEREQFVARLNSLVTTAMQQAVLERAVHSLEFDFKKRSILLKRAPFPGAKADDFQPVKELGHTGSYVWPEQFEIKQFFIEGQDVIKAYTRSETGQAWFFVVPEGLVQEVIINFLDTKDTIDGQPRKVGLVLNPFTAQFKSYDNFQK